MKGKRNFIKVGGWMKYKKSGFTILESIIYIFLSTMIIAEGLNLFMPMYKTYLEIKNKSIRSNEYENKETNPIQDNDKQLQKDEEQELRKEQNDQSNNHLNK